MPARTNGRINGIKIFEDAPILKGTVKHQPDPNVHNIMITGGAGFMYVLRFLRTVV
jgi:hypothetical protein